MGAGSIDWFSVGIDPLIVYLDKRLKGILVSTLPVFGPVLENEPSPLPPIEERFKVMGYCDDTKSAITSTDEFIIADHAATLFEKSAGTKLHRDPASDKCKFLPVGKWRKELIQSDIPTDYMRICDTLDIVGVQLSAVWSKSRQKNGLNSRKKFLPLGYN